MNLPRTVLTRTAAGALAGTGLVAASVLGVQSATAGTATTTSAVADHTAKAGRSGHDQARCHTFRLRVGKAPDALKQDLEQARKKLRDSDAKGSDKRAERREALTTIREAAEKGTYGKEVQQRLEKRQQRIEKHRASLPEKLRSDLDAVQKMQPGADRRAAAKKIREGRLDGTYGTEVQQHAQAAKKKREQHEQTCQDQRQQRKEKKESGSSSTEG